MLIDRANISRTALQGQVAVVTGAGQGIGEETARMLAHLGACVVLAELNETGRATQLQIEADGGRALFVRTDVSDASSMEQLHSQAAAAFGPVSILVNNAEANVMKALLDHSLAEWDRVLAVNLRGAFLGIKEFLPEMLQRKHGVVITFESAEGMPYMSAYLATKVGLRSLALSLAQEVGEASGVAVYCFGAGMVETPGAMAAFEQLAPLYHLTLDEFIRQSAPGGQLISAELCATGLVGTILAAKDFHGQGDVGYVLGLSKLGLDPQGEPWKAEVLRVPAAVMSEASTAAGDARRHALELNCKLDAILRANIKEYDALSLFQRPVVKRMFQQGTGLKVDEWLASAQDMTRQLEDTNVIRSATLEAYIVQLRRLADFITKQESDARGWIKDPQQLQVALQALAERKATTLQLASAVAQMKQEEKA